ncbi:MAG: AAA family ATPase [Nannocystis sp.]|uniref:AAA family ATPase n=1 Tax=Nannocystis sp. TaxID=1962667 RepID=UPI00242051AF|nr:AAA family ATPase [Nannocystis sp.]MBK9758025.1 AAA family ATPase [Nannocystis sp.]
MAVRTPLDADRCTTQVRAQDIPEAALIQASAERELSARIAPQGRAVEALRRGLAERAPGFNVAVVGKRGTGRTFTAIALARAEAGRRPAPRDLVLLTNPRWPLEPVPAFLAPGTGPAFVRAMTELHARLESAIHEVFEGRVRSRLQLEVHREQSAAERKLHDALGKIAATHGMGLVANDDGFDFVPLDDQADEEADRQGDDHPADDPADAAGSATEIEDDERAGGISRQYLDAIEALRPHVEETQRQLALLEAESNANLLHRQREALRRDIEASFAAIPTRVLATAQLQQFITDLHAHLREIYHLEEGHHLPLTAAPLPAGLVIPTLLITNSEGEPAPIVHAQNVTLSGLFGRVVAGSGEGRYPEPGTILAGDIHRANGGFLILDAEALVKRERVYEHLKACLLARSIQPYEDTEGPPLLRVQPAPLDVKVVLVADPDLIIQLQELDPEFGRLFKIRADFADDMSIEEGLTVYPGVTSWLAANRGLPRCSRSAVAFLMHYGARLAEDQNRLTTNLGLLSDLITEATSLALGSEELTDEHLKAAVKLMRDRQGQLRDRLLDMHRYGQIRVELSGAHIGQINGLAVVSDGFQSVGRPCRVTAVTYAGEQGPLNIEREVEMSGPIHSKGVLILAGYLHDRFARDYRLGFDASVVFEQTYLPIEGDSASTAELFALLSSLARLPARQDIGVTGSVDQRGRVLPVGGVNEKVEGFFDVCSDHGLSGSQGVIIPESNVRNLVLREDVLAAMEAGRFFIWPISTVEEGVELLLGQPAGQESPDVADDEVPNFRFGAQTVYGRIERRLARLRRLAQNEPMTLK